MTIDCNDSKRDLIIYTEGSTRCLEDADQRKSMSISREAEENGEMTRGSREIMQRKSEMKVSMNKTTSERYK